jgi:hypothetical protein
MKKNLIIASLLVALVAPAAQAAGLSLDTGSTPEQITLPALIPPVKTEGGFLGKSRFALHSNPRTLRMINGNKTGTRTDSRWFTPYNGPAPEVLNPNGNGIPGGNPPSVPEPDGMALALAAGILGLAFRGYSSIQRRRVHGAA